MKAGDCGIRHRRVGVPRTGSGIRHNGRVSTGKRGASGRHAGPARLEAAAPPSGSGKGSQLLLALGVTASVVAWGYLVYLAIDFGTSARDGDGRGWVFLALATLGAIACLFLALTLGTRLLERVRANRPPPAAPRPPGGRRAAR